MTPFFSKSPAVRIHPLRRVLPAFLFLFFIASSVQGQFALNWKRTYKSSLNSANKAICLRTDNLRNLLVLAYTWLPDSTGDIMVIKLDPAGKMIWQRIYDGPLHTDDRPVDMVVDRYNNVWICGTSRTKNKDTDILLLRFTDEGVLANNETFGLHEGLFDAPTSVAVDRTGSPVVAGYVSSPDSGLDFAILRYNIEGKLLWHRTVSTGRMDIANDVVTDDSCNIYLAGTLDGGSHSSDLLAAKYDSSGSESWRFRFNGNESDNDAGSCIALDDSFNVYVSGFSNHAADRSDLPLLKLDRSGNLLMELSYDCESADCLAERIITFKNSALLVAGYSDFTSQESGSIHYQFAMNGGRSVFERRFSSGDYFYRMVNERNYRLVIGGRLNAEQGTLQPAFLVAEKDGRNRFSFIDTGVYGLAYIRDVAVEDKRVYFLGDDAGEANGTASLFSYSMDPAALDAYLKKNSSQ
ncbi:MAG: hypothetical protein RL213_83 [Bacteroidota bacterium]